MPHVTHFTVVDVETTGLDPAIDRIVEIAAVRYEGRKLVGSYQSLVNPHIDIPPTSSAVHHLTAKDLAGAPSLEAVVPDLRSFCAGTTMVAHNAEFDCRFLPFLESDWLCTLRFARHLWPELPSFKNQFLRYALGIDLPFDGEHRAFADVKVTGEVLFRELETYRDRGLTWTKRAVLAYIAQPTPYVVMDFGKYRGSLVGQVPSDYLQWVINKSDRTEELKSALAQELRCRSAQSISA